MAREWKPGTVAMVSGQDGEETRALRQEGQWATEGRAYLYDHQVKIRELVVIDPETLVPGVSASLVADVVYAAATQTESEEPTATKSIAVLHAIAKLIDDLVTPPKPEEPAGLGAVVLDDQGQRWVRFRSVHTGWWWRNDRGESRRYEDVPAVRVLSEGVQTDD